MESLCLRAAAPHALENLTISNFPQAYGCNKVCLPDSLILLPRSILAVTKNDIVNPALAPVCPGLRRLHNASHAGPGGQCISSLPYPRHFISRQIKQQPQWKRACTHVFKIRRRPLRSRSRRSSLIGPSFCRVFSGLGLGLMPPYDPECTLPQPPNPREKLRARMIRRRSRRSLPVVRGGCWRARWETERCWAGPLR